MKKIIGTFLLLTSMSIIAGPVDRIEDCAGDSSEAICTAKVLLRVIQRKGGGRDGKPGNPECFVTKYRNEDQYGKFCGKYFGFCTSFYKYGSMVNGAEFGSGEASSAAKWCDKKLSE